MAPKSEAFQAYQKVADHMARDQYQEAKSWTAGATLQQVDLLLQPAPNYGSTPVGLYKSVMSDQAVKQYGRNLTRELAGDVGETAYKVESEQEHSDGQTVKIVAVRQVARYRAGKVSPNISVVRHIVELKHDPAGWKVYAFQEQP